jgi:hypothetical protein
MKRSLIWILAACVAMAVFAVGRALDLPDIVVLLLAFAGAVVGTAGATWLVLRLLGGPEGSQSPPAAPRARGNGRKAR